MVILTGNTGNGRSRGSGDAGEDHGGIEAGGDGDDVSAGVDDVKKEGESLGMDYWMLMTGEEGEQGINGGMYQRPGDRKLYTFDCTIGVADIDKAIEDVKKNGGEIRGEKMEMPGVGWFAGGVDTEGNAFGLIQMTKR